MAENLIHLHSKRSTPSLVQAYHQGIISAFNDQTERGTVSKSESRVMVGYLSAAFLALRLTGNECAASRIESACASIERDWTCYEREVRALSDWLSSID